MPTSGLSSALLILQVVIILYACQVSNRSPGQSTIDVKIIINFINFLVQDRSGRNNFYCIHFAIQCHDNTCHDKEQLISQPL